MKQNKQWLSDKFAKPQETKEEGKPLTRLEQMLKTIDNMTNNDIMRDLDVNAQRQQSLMKAGYHKKSRDSEEFLLYHTICNNVRGYMALLQERGCLNMVEKILNKYCQKNYDHA